MNDQAYVRLVDTHTESVGRDDDPALVVLPALLPLILLVVLQSGMEKIGFNALLPEQGSDFFRALAVTDIDNRRARNPVQDMDECLVFVFCSPDDVGQVLTGETFLVNPGPFETQFLLDIGDNLGRSGSGQGEHRYVG